MTVSRRHAVKIAGMGAASLTLSCGTTTPIVGEPEPGDEKCCKPEEPMEHELAIRSRGQYVVVEAVKSSPYSYRGRLEVIWGDRVTISNETKGPVLLLFPAMIEEGRGGFVDFREDKTDACKCSYETGLEGLAALLLKEGGCCSFKIPQNVEPGRYEYVVLFDTGQVERDGKSGGFVSRWSHATGGSSSEFIIRRRR